MPERRIHANERLTVIAENRKEIDPSWEHHDAKDETKKNGVRSETARARHTRGYRASVASGRSSGQHEYIS